MRTIPSAALALVSACATPQEVADEAVRKSLEPYKAAFCAMTEAERSAYLTKKLQKVNASAVNIGGKWHDSTLVTSRELGEERYTWRKGTGC
jgi:hypothetical protein